jgi:hypothetical protein
MSRKSVPNTPSQKKNINRKKLTVITENSYCRLVMPSMKLHLI